MNFIARIFKKRYILITIITVLLFGALGSLYNVFVKNRQKSMVIEFNYPGSEKGLNPDGSVFEISELKSAEVIEKAKENLADKDLDTEFLRSRIFITSKVSEQSINKIISAVQSEKNIVYMSTTFYIYYSQKDKFSKNESKLFMESLAKAYTDYFGEKYTEKNDILAFKPSDYKFEDTDYVEIHDILKNKVDSMLSYIKTHQNENRAFYSEDRENLGMAAKKLESYRDTELEKFYSYIVQNGISKDNASYLDCIDYFIDEKEIEYRKLIEGSEIIKDATQLYNQDIAVAFVPSVDAKHNYYMSRTKTSVDYLTKQSYTNGISASKVLKEIDYYRDLKKKFSVNTNEEKQATAENMISELLDELKQISDEVLKTDNEYLKHKTMNYFAIRLPHDDELRIMLIAKFMILGFLLAFAMVFFLEFLKPKFLKRIQIMEDAFSVAEFAKKKRGE